MKLDPETLDVAAKAARNRYIANPRMPWEMSPRTRG